MFEYLLGFCYVTIACIVGRVVIRWSKDEELAFASALFWPVFIPIFAGIIILYVIIKILKLILIGR